MRIILLGASGQIGSELYKELRSNASFEVIGTSRRSYGRYFQFDPFTDDWSVLGKADVLINSVGQIEAKGSMSFEKVHCELTQLIVKNRALLGNPRVIQISVLGANKESPAEFMHTKAMADEYLLQFKNTVVVRPSIVCTPNTVMVQKLKMMYTLSQLTFGYAIVPKNFPDYKFQPVLVSDLAVIVSRLCITEYPPKMINVVGPEAFSYREVMEILFRRKGKKLKLLQMPKGISDLLVKGIVSTLFPSVINKQQYHLVFQHNIADKSDSEKYLGHPLSSTIDFWIKEFK